MPDDTHALTSSSSPADSIAGHLDARLLRYSPEDWALLDAENTRLLEDPQVGLRHYCEDCWSILEPENPFIPNWHLDAVCDVLMAVTRGDLHDVLITMPPRVAKSLSVVVFWPTWEWGPAKKPHLRCLFFSYGAHLTIRDARKRRLIMDSSWYRSRWPHVQIGKGDWETNNAVRYENSKRGFHQASSTGGMSTGEGGDRIIADDILKADDAYSDTIREGANQWWAGSMPSRRNTGRGRHTSRIVMAQRLHESDLPGYILSTDSGYYHLNLPMEFDPKRVCVLPAVGSYPGFRDPRTREGEVLVPAALIPSSDPTLDQQTRLTKLKKEMIKAVGSTGYEAQFNQKPEAQGGAILKRAWWRYYVPAGHPLAGTMDENGHRILILPRTFDRVAQFWDCAFKDKETSAFVVGQDWAVKGPYAYLRRMKRDRLDFRHTLFAIQDLRTKGKPEAIYIEDKANGPAIISVLQQLIPSVIPVEVGPSDGDKVARAHAAAPKVEAGNFVLPHPTLPPGLILNEDHDETSLGVECFLHETSTFPASTYADIVDTFTMAHKFLYLTEPFDEDHFTSEDLGF